MLRITGYSDKYSVCPGDNIQFYINSENNEVYETQIVRLIHGDTNPEGPGYKEEEIQVDCNKSYPGRNQSCLLYTSPSPRDVEESRMPSSA